MTILWFCALMITVALGIVLNSMVPLAVMVGPLFVWHVWMALR